MGVAEGLGAIYLGNRQCRFRVWAPAVQNVQVHMVYPEEKLVPLYRESGGYHQADVSGVGPGSLYFYSLDGGKERPDPASRFQPKGVHGPSQVVDCCFEWEDSCWFGLPLRRYIVYELHVGTFTPEGSFDAVISHLDELTELGITAVELMPVAQFPGERNWGYDGVYSFAVQNSYGTPEALKRLVNACHQRGLAVILDVVYNHLGPEGNYLADFGPYFTERYRTPWGQAVNFDGPDSNDVRRFFIENALHWVTEYHFDALRLDAVHAILDQSPQPFLVELADAVRERAEQLNRRVYIIAESAANEARLVQPCELGGYGLDAVWNDDFHHCLHVLLTGERAGYYEDYGGLWQLVKAFREGFVYSGQYSRYRRRRHGSSTRTVPAERFVVSAQNHDQVGNRMDGERLGRLVSFEALKLAAGLVFLSPYVPLIFMGEEYGEVAPFQYFVSHSDRDLVEAVLRGRREEFAAFGWQGEPPDPQDEATYHRSRLDRGLRDEASHRCLLEFHKELIRLRKTAAALACLSKDCLDVWADESSGVLVVRRWLGGDRVCAVFHFGKNQESVGLPFPAGRWQKLMDSAEERWLGPGSALPSLLTSDGGVRMMLPAQAFAVFAGKEEA